MPPHPVRNFETQTYYQSKSQFNGVSSRISSMKIKDGVYVINLDEFKSIGTHWIALYVNGNSIIYFDNFGIEHIPKEIKKFMRNKNIITNIYRVQAYHSMMSGYFCIGFFDFVLKGKSLLDYTNFLLMIMRKMVK